MLYPNPKTDERWPVIQNGIANGVRHNINGFCLKKICDLSYLSINRKGCVLYNIGTVGTWHIQCIPIKSIYSCMWKIVFNIIGIDCCTSSCTFRAVKYNTIKFIKWCVDMKSHFLFVDLVFDLFRAASSLFAV